MQVNTMRFQGMIALNTQQVGHSKINQLANAAGTEAVARDPKGKSYAIELSKADDPARVDKDIRFILGELAVDKIPFAYDPTNTGDFTAAADRVKTDIMETVVPEIQAQQPFHFRLPEPAAKQKKQPLQLPKPFNTLI